MVEGKLRKASQIDAGILTADILAYSLQSKILMDNFCYATSPTVFYDVDGTFTVPALTGGGSEFDTGNMAGDEAGVAQATAMLPFGGGFDYKLRILARTETIVEDYFFIGVSGDKPTAADPPVEPMDAVYFRRVDSAMVANWEAVCIDGGSETAVDTGIAGDANAHEFEIDFTPTSVVFKIDGVKVATITTDVPANGCGLLIYAVTGENVAKAITAIGYIAAVEPDHV